MKKFLLLTLLSILISSVTFAQKNYKRQAQALAKKYKPILKTPTGERVAAYLVDSSKIKFHDMGDSTVFFAFKFKYNPNGTVKSDENFVDFFGLFEIYSRNNYFYNAAKPLQLKYIDLYDSQDKGVAYDKVAVDSLFYDAKDRVVLDRTRDIADKSITGYTTYKYKTVFETADTVRAYTLDDAEEKLIPDVFTYNTLDVRGNIVVIIGSKPDNLTDEFGLDSKDEFLYNAQNQVAEQLTSTWNKDFSKWQILSKALNRYNSNGTLKNTLTLGNYFEDTKLWGEKDSTYYRYNAKGLRTQAENYAYDDTKNAYELVSKDLNKYDANGNQVRNESYSGSQADPLVLELGLSIDNWYSLYKDAIATKDFFSTDFDIVVANPMTDNQVLTLNSKLEGEYTLLTYDLNGKEINRQMIKNNQTVTPQLPVAGTYIFFVTDSQNTPLAMKKVVKM
jgi:hypothetical protein